MNILAIDPALCSGWATSSGKWGIRKFAKHPWRHPFSHYLDFRGWLVELIELHAATALAAEGVISSGHRGNGQRHEWHGIVLSVAAEMDIPLAIVMPSSLKKYATGNGRAERPQMRTALRERFGIDLPEDQHDAIAAIWVLSWAQREHAAGRIVREWSGFPGRGGVGRDWICNRCEFTFFGSSDCPRCGFNVRRVEA